MFTLLAKERFEHVDSEDKKCSLRQSREPDLTRSKIGISASIYLFKIKEGVKKTNDEINRLEPEKSPSNHHSLKFFVKSFLWCRRADLFTSHFASLRALV